MRLKKVIAFGITVVMTVSALTACGNAIDNSMSPVTETSQTISTVTAETSQTAVDESKDDITFPLKEKLSFEGLAMVVDEKYPLSDNLAWKYLQERANVEYTLTEIPNAETKEKGNLIMASGDYPDFLFKMQALDLNQYGMDGALIPLEDMIKQYAPNLCALLDERDGWGTITASDGHIYSLPMVGNQTFAGKGNAVIFINQKWLDNLGLDMPNNYEDVYNVLKAFKEKDANGNGDPNDEIPYNCRNIFGEYGIANWLIYQGDASHYYSNYMAVRDGEPLFYPYDDGFKEFIEWMTKFYQEELLYEGVLTQTHDQYKALGKVGEVYGMVITNRVAVYTPEENWGDYVPMPTFNQSVVALSNGIQAGGLAITDKCENPEVLIAWADWLYSEEGGRVAAYGPENVTWKWNDDGTFSSALGEENYESTFQYNLKGSAAVPYYNSPNNSALHVQTNVANNMSSKVYAEGGVFASGVYLPTLTLTEDEKEISSVIMTDVSAYIETYIAEVITGKISLDDTWEEFKSTLKRMGADELFGYYKDAYERAVTE